MTTPAPATTSSSDPPPTTSGPASFKDRSFIAVIGDEDTVTGLLLSGIGHSLPPPQSSKTFMVVDAKTSTAEIERAFEEYVVVRKDVAILLINQHVADKIRYKLDSYTSAFPAVLEIPSKDHPYDPEKDSVLRRVKRLFGE
ncbi:ATP synthase (F/14-kDa) subunit-domain-containing protein [Peziza echinospora]|nr:ATP synthase (F/14-kDa) subunit-domain-containing protein [Peziza echinospora]